MQVALTNEVLLCEACRTDSDQACARLDQRVEMAIQLFCRVLYAANTQAQARYDVVCKARRTMQGSRKYDAAYGASVLQRITVAKAQGDGLSAILLAETNLYTEFQAIEGAHRELALANEIESISDKW